jgi:hypothetical protein
LVLIELGLCDLDGCIEILVGQLRTENLVAVLDEVCRFDAALGPLRFSRFPPRLSRSNSAE